MTTANPTKSQSKRRLLSFSLRTLLAVMLVLGCGLGWIGVQWQQARRHNAVAREIEELGGGLSFSNLESPPAWKLWIFGDYAVRKSLVALYDTQATDSLFLQMKGMNCEGLYLASTKITDAGLVHLQGMPQLMQLDLSGTQVTDTGLAHLQGMPSLNYLTLIDTQITDDGLKHLQGMTSLQDLYLSDTRVTGAGLKHLQGTHLDFLSLEGTQVTDQHLKHLQYMPMLESLDLANTRITDEGLTHLTRAKKLTWLRLELNHLSQQTIDRLQQAMPKCYIRCSPLQPTAESSP